MYCLNCGSKNDLGAKKCKKCNNHFKVTHHDPKKKYSQNVPTTSEFKDDRYSGKGVVSRDFYVRPDGKVVIPESNSYDQDLDVVESNFDDIMPEPLSQEEIDNLKIANANQSIKLKDAIKKDTKKKTSRKRKKN